MSTLVLTSVEEITKRYDNLKAAHRQWRHEGHCCFIHGENWAFDITFASETRDSCGFIVDFGKLRPLRDALEKWFDHVLLIDHDDPQLEVFHGLHVMGVTDLRVVDSCSAEGLAKKAYQIASIILSGNPEWVARGVRVTKVVCYEDNKNSATYRV